MFDLRDIVVYINQFSFILVTFLEEALEHFT
jgi:hypothetical protein